MDESCTSPEILPNIKKPNSFKFHAVPQGAQHDATLGPDPWVHGPILQLFLLARKDVVSIHAGPIIGVYRDYIIYRLYRDYIVFI